MESRIAGQIPGGRRKTLQYTPRRKFGCLRNLNIDHRPSLASFIRMRDAEPMSRVLHSEVASGFSGLSVFAPYQVLPFVIEF